MIAKHFLIKEYKYSNELVLAAKQALLKHKTNSNDESIFKKDKENSKLKYEGVQKSKESHRNSTNNLLLVYYSKSYETSAHSETEKEKKNISEKKKNLLKNSKHATKLVKEKKYPKHRN